LLLKPVVIWSTSSFTRPLLTFLRNICIVTGSRAGRDPKTPSFRRRRPMIRMCGTTICSVSQGV
jgi:hypothetical protein